MLFSSEAVSAGHPDKVCDKIADYVLDSYIRQDPLSHVACEVTATKNLILVTGEVNSSANVDIEQSVKTVLNEIGYGYWYKNEKIEILNRMGKQSTQICNAVGKGEEVAAGDQGIMFGYACSDSDNYMPLAHALSFELIDAIQNDINVGFNKVTTTNLYGWSSCFYKWDSAFKPDLKTQVTVDDVDGTIDTILISVCHKESFDLNEIRDYVNLRIITPFKNKHEKRITDKTKYYINPAGAWTDGGFFFDTGLSGRKIVVDNYGGYCPVGGGSFSGKDPSKVDRSAAYFARYLAKNIVAKKGCKECLIQMAFGIGLVQPISVCAKIDNKVFDLTKELDIDMSVTGIINRLDLRNPIYYETASGGHFGRDKFSWEKLDLNL